MCGKCPPGCFLFEAFREYRDDLRDHNFKGDTSQKRPKSEITSSLMRMRLSSHAPNLNSYYNIHVLFCLVCIYKNTLRFIFVFVVILIIVHVFNVDMLLYSNAYFTNIIHSIPLCGMCEHVAFRFRYPLISCLVTRIVFFPTVRCLHRSSPVYSPQ